MNVLLVMSDAADRADAVVVSRRLLPALQVIVNSGEDVTVALCGDDWGLGEELGRVAPVRVLRASLPPSGRGLVQLPRAVVGLRRVMADVQPDVVEGDGPIAAVAAALAAGRRYPPVLYRRHHERGRRRLLVASRLAARNADLTVVSCAAMRTRAIEDDRTVPSRVLVATSGTPPMRAVDLCEVDALRRRLGVTVGDRVVLSAARLRWEKGMDVLVDAAGRLGSGVNVVIIGSGPERDALTSQVAASAGTVHLVGHVDDIAPWYGIADVVAIPSRAESFGRSTVEAMSASRPVVASRVGGLVEGVVDGVTGVLVPPGDARALAAALDAVLEDAARRVSMGDAARRLYESSYTIEGMASSWRRAWADAVTMSDRQRARR